MGETGIGGRVELPSRETTPASVPLLGVGFMSPLKSKIGILFVTLRIYIGWTLALCCNRRLFSQRCLSLPSAWRRCYDPSSLLQMSNINLLDIKQAASHPWCLPQQQGATHGQGGGRRRAEHGYAPSASPPPTRPCKPTTCFICSSRWGDHIFEPLEIN